MPLLKPRLIILKINKQSYEPIEYKNMLGAFTSNNALAIYAFKTKRLYIWKGKDLDFNVGKLVPGIKNLILQKDPRTSILRNILIESGSEPEEFFADLRIKPDKLQDQIDQSGIPLFAFDDIEEETPARAEVQSNVAEFGEAQRNAAEEGVQSRAAPELDVLRKAAEEKKVRENELLSQSLQLVEEKYEQARANNIFFATMKSINEIIDIAEQLKRTDIIQKYNDIKQEMQDKLEEEAKNYAHAREQIDKINQMKKEAIDLETRLLFVEAHNVYQSIRALAKEIGDKATLRYCDKKVAEIESWQNDANESDLLRWDLPAINILEDQNFHLLEAYNNQDAAQKRANEITSNSGDTEAIRIITLVRPQFSSQGPFNDKGECFAIYGSKVQNPEPEILENE